MPSLAGTRARNAEIYRLFAEERVSQRDLARRFLVSQGRIAQIVSRERRGRAVEGLPPLEAEEVEAPRPASRFDRWPRVKASLVPTRIVAMTHFGADVEHADPAKAEAERRPLWGGRYPKSPAVHRSAIGSPAQVCAEEAG